MENAADALKMAASVLIFVLALSISINAFGEARRTSQTILDYKDREYDYTYVEENGTTRTVGVETVIPSIYKAYKENYKIIFNVTVIQNNKGVYQKKNEEGNLYSINEIDLEKEVLGSDTQKEEFIMAILYGNQYKPSEYTQIKEKFKSNLGIYLNDEGIYGKIKNIRLKENLGVYYQEETNTDSSSAPDANKTKKRVITYTQ